MQTFGVRFWADIGVSQRPSQFNQKNPNLNKLFIFQLNADAVEQFDVSEDALKMALSLSLPRQIVSGSKEINKYS